MVPTVLWRRRAALLPVALTLVGLAAYGYVLPGGSILRRMTQGREDLRLSGLKVDGSLTFYGTAAAEAGTALGVTSERPELTVDGTVVLRLPGRCRFEVSSTESGRSVAAVSSHGRRRFDGGELAALAVLVENLCPLLASRSSGDNEARATIDRHLASQQVESRKTSLGRFGGTVAYVLGDPAEGQPQLWVTKDTFLPTRMKVSDGQGGLWDVRLLDYGSPATGEAFPRVVELYRGKDPVLRFTALRADSRSKVDDRLL